MNVRRKTKSGKKRRARIQLITLSPLDSCKSSLKKCNLKVEKLEEKLKTSGPGWGEEDVGKHTTCPGLESYYSVLDKMEVKYKKMEAEKIKKRKSRKKRSRKSRKKRSRRSRKKRSRRSRKKRSRRSRKKRSRRSRKKRSRRSRKKRSRRLKGCSGVKKQICQDERLDCHWIKNKGCKRNPFYH